MVETRAAFKTGVSAVIYTNTNRLIKGNTVRDKFLVMADSVLFIDSDKNVADGYLGIDSASKVDISFIKASSPSGKFLKDNGTWASVFPNQSGNSGKFLTTDGTNVSWASVSGASPVGGDGSIQYSIGGSFAGSDNFIWEESSLYFKVDGYSLFGLATDGGEIPTAFVDIAGANPDRASLRIRAATAESGGSPTSPNSGDIWQDGEYIYIHFDTGTYKFMLEPA